MKKIILISILICLNHLANSQVYKGELVANGLTCSLCSNATLKQLKTIPFLDSIDIDIESTKFMLNFKPNTTYDLNLIKEKVEDAGFSVGSLILTMKLQNITVENDFQYSLDGILYHFIDTKKKTLTDIGRFKVLDKGFMSEKEFKKYEKVASKYPCYNTSKSNPLKQHYHLKVIE